MKTTVVNPSNINRRDAMKGGIGAASLTALGTGVAVPAALSTVAVTLTTNAAQAQASGAMPQVTEPATGIVMHPD
jgi:hypothetical protein